MHVRAGHGVEKALQINAETNRNVGLVGIKERNQKYIIFYIDFDEWNLYYPCI